MWLRRSVILAIAASGAAVAAPKSPEWPDCDTGAPAQQIVSCRNIIAKGEEKPEDLAMAYYRRGNGYDDTGDVARARADYEKAIQLNPKYGAPYNAIGILDYNAKAYDKAIASYDRALAVDPKDWRALNNKGNALLALKRYADAVKSYDAAIAINAGVAAAYVNRGAALGRMRLFDKAQSDFAQALKLDRTYAPAYLGRATLYLDLLQPTRAIADASEYIRLRPDDTNGYWVRAAAATLKRDIAAAKADLSKAISLDPNNADAYVVRGNANVITGDDDAAAADFDKALGLNPANSAALGSRGTLRFRRERYELAIADLEKSLAIDPSLTWFQDTLKEARAAKAALEKRKLADVPSQGPPPLKKRAALIIGNSKYTGISPLKNPARDAASVAAELKSKGYDIFGYPKTDMTRAQMFDAIKAFEAAAANADTALVWYAGHGQEFDTGGGQSGNWLIPVDFSSNGDISENGVPLSRLVTAASPARTLRVVIIDACRKNNMPAAQRGARGFRVEERSDMLIVFSTRAGRLADDGDGDNSPFAKAFLDEMKESAKLDVRQFFGGVAQRMESLGATGQEPERIDRMKSRATLALAP